MARLQVRIAANNHPTDPSLDPLRTHPGDVIIVHDDDHQFSYCELHNGEYRIVDVPGVLEEDLGHLKDHVEDDQGNMVLKRAKSLDLAAIDTLQLPKPSDEVVAAIAPRDAAKSAIGELVKEQDRRVDEMLARYDVDALPKDDAAQFVNVVRSLVADQMKDATAAAASDLADAKSAPVLVDHVAACCAAVNAIVIVKDSPK